MSQFLKIKWLSRNVKPRQTLEWIINKYIYMYKNIKGSSPSDCMSSQNNSCQINPITSLSGLPWKKPTEMKHHLFIPRWRRWSRICLPMKETQQTRVQSMGGEDPLEEENGNPLQYSCLKNSMGRTALWATVHGVTESDMTEQLSTHTQFIQQLTFIKQTLWQEVCSVVL